MNGAMKTRAWVAVLIALLVVQTASLAQAKSTCRERATALVEQPAIQDVRAAQVVVAGVMGGVGGVVGTIIGQSIRKDREIGLIEAECLAGHGVSFAALKVPLKPKSEGTETETKHGSASGSARVQKTSCAVKAERCNQYCDGNNKGFICKSNCQQKLDSCS